MLQKWKTLSTWKKLGFILLIFVGIELLLYLILRKEIFSLIIDEYYRQVYRKGDAEHKLYGNAVRDVAIFSGAIFTIIFTYWRNSIAQKQMHLQGKQIEKQGEQIKIQGEQLTIQAGQLKIQTQQLTLQTTQTENNTQQIENQTRELQIKDQQRNDEQFKQAVEMLGKTDGGFALQQGAVFILVALALRSPEHTQRCTDMLCSLNEWMAERLAREPDYFRRKDETDKDFVMWIDRIFAGDTTSLTAYWNRYIKHGEETDLTASAISSEQLAAARAACAAERLSQLVIKELRKIIEQLEPEADGQSRSLDLGQRYLPQLDVSDLELGNRAKFTNTNLQGANLDRGELQGVRLDDANLQGASLDIVNLRGVSLASANLQGASLHYANLQRARLVGANLQGVSLNYAQLQGAHLYHTDLQGASLLDADLQGASLIGTQLQGARLYYVDLQGARLLDADLQGASLHHANLRGALLTGANLTGIAHDGLITEGCFATHIIFNEDANWAEVREGITNEAVLEELDAAAKRTAAWIEAGTTLSLPADAAAWQKAIVQAAKDFPQARKGILQNLLRDLHNGFRGDLPEDFMQAKEQAIAEIKALGDQEPS
jgi:uncharacterized protein YjbI with pentapeptide repeats